MLSPDMIFNNTGFNGQMLFRQKLLFWITAGVLLFAFLWTPSLVEKELIFAESAREMVSSGNWFHRSFNFCVTPEPPFPVFWGCALFTELFGNTEFAVRLSSALMALGALYLLGNLGKTLFNEKTAAIACWMFLGSAGFLISGTTASADMAETLVILLAVAWFCELEQKRSFSFYLIFYLIFFAGAFVKGIFHILPVLLILLPCIFGSEKKKAHLNLNHGTAFCTAVLCYLLCQGIMYLMPWSGCQSCFADGGFAGGVRAEWARLLRTPEVLMQQNWGKWGQELLFQLLPWIFILPAGIASFLRGEFPRKAKQLFSGSCCAFFASVLLSGGAPEAILDFLPFAMLFCAAGFSCNTMKKLKSRLFSAAWYFCMILASVCCVSIIAYPLWGRVTAYVPNLPLVLAPAAAGAVSWWALFMDHTENSSFSRLMGLPHRLSSFLFAGTILSGAFFAVVYPLLLSECNTGKKFFPEFQKRALESVSAGAPLRIAVFGTPAPAGYLFYNDVPTAVPQADDMELLAKKYPGERVILLMKQEKSILEKFIRECRKHNVTPEKTLLSEETPRWRFSSVRQTGFTACSVNLPGTTKKERTR